MELTKSTYVKKAEEIILGIKKDAAQNQPGSGRNPRDSKVKLLNPTQIRNLLTLVNEVYNIVRYSREAKLSEELCERIQYIKMRFAYEAGRDEGVRLFIERSGMLKLFDEVGNSREQFLQLSHYMEALVAYHKFYSDER